MPRASTRTGRPRKDGRTPEQTRRLLIAAAGDTIAESGYDGASLQAIAKRAGLTSGTIYRHFECKAELFLALIDEAIGAIPLRHRLDPSTPATPALFSDLIRAYASPELASVRRLAVEVTAAASRDETAATLLRQLTRRVVDGLTDHLAACQQQGLTSRKQDPRLTASLINLLVMGLAHSETLAPELIGDPAWLEHLDASTDRLIGTLPGYRTTNP